MWQRRPKWKGKKLRTQPHIRQSTYRSPVTLCSCAPCEVAHCSDDGGGIVSNCVEGISLEDGGACARRR